MERRSSVDLENVASSKEISPESPPAANVAVDSSPAAETHPRTPDNQITSSPSGSAIVVDQPSPSDSGYIEANSSTISADSTQAQAGGESLESSPGIGDAVEIKERFVSHYRYSYSIRSHWCDNTSKENVPVVVLFRT